MKRQIFFFFLFVLSGQIRAQVVDLDRSRLSQAAFYNYSEEGDITIKVHVWGAVRFPGLYEIPRGSKLSELVSLAGGPQFAERTRRSRRTVRMKLHRPSGEHKPVVYDIEMENQIVVDGEDPVISHGDVLSFESVVEQGFRWRDLFPVVSMVGTLVLIVDSVSR